MKKKLFITIIIAIGLFVSSFMTLAADDKIIDDPSIKVNVKDATKISYAGRLWFVIGKDSQANQLTLFSADKVHGVRYSEFLSNSTNNHPYSGTKFNPDNSTAYSGSTLQANFTKVLQMDFSLVEQAAINKRSLDDVEGDMPVNQSIWPLSYAEANALFDGNNTYSGDKTIRQAANPDHWWMRTPYNNSYGKGVIMADGGGVYYQQYGAPNAVSYGIRPAFYLNLNKVVFYNNADELNPTSSDISTALKPYTAPTSNQYKLTLIDENIMLDIEKVKIDNGKLLVEYANATTGVNNYLVVCYKSATATYYGIVKQLDTASGSLTITGPENLSNNFDVEFYNVKFNHATQTNPYVTNYSSTPVKFKSPFEWSVTSQAGVMVFSESFLGHQPTEFTVTKTLLKNSINSCFGKINPKDYISSFNVKINPGTTIIDGAKYTVHFILSSVEYANKKIYIYHYNGSKVEEHEVTVDQYGVAVIQTTSLSPFLLSKKKRGSEPPTGDNNNLLLVTTFTTISALLAFVVIKNLKKSEVQ